MCVAMVIIQTKTLEKKGVEDVTSKESNLELPPTTTMSQGTTLFSCGIMETDRWRDMGRGCGSSLESLWDALPEACPAREGAAAGSISGLLRDLSLSEAPPTTATTVTAPPSKRQCRSVSCSDELAGHRSPWRPQGSRVWTAVEKRRCHSGGSVQRGSSCSSSYSSCSSSSSSAGAFAQLGFPGMQRSSSFSLPSRSCLGAGGDLPRLSPAHPRTPLFPAFGPCSEPPPPLYLSHEQICLPEAGGPSEGASSPDSTPEMERRAVEAGSGPGGGLARSRSQPCVLNDKKIGMKRRRPSDTHKQRPSLDLAKMTQKLPNFHSLSCPGITGASSCQSSYVPPTSDSVYPCEGLFSSVCDQGAEPRLNAEEETVVDDLDGDFPAYTDLTSSSANGKEREPLWAGLCGMRRDVHQLGGELDIEQIERN